MNYDDALEYLYSQLPMYQRIGPPAYKPGLGNTIALCNYLNNPQNNFASVHIAGTNGKGSTSHFMAAILQVAGYKVGLYTSPHLKDFRERIKINGEMISKEYITGFLKNHKSFFGKIKPSFFEMTVCLAFDYFSNEKVDIAIIETGMGGRLDSTNVITPVLSVITNIGLDHTQFLGDTLGKIAYEKAGIIKQNIPVVIGENHDETDNVFEQVSLQRNARCYFAENSFSVKNINLNISEIEFDVYYKHKLLYGSLKSDLTGIYQTKNIITTLQSLICLKKSGYEADVNQIRAAFRDCKKITGLSGRWEIIGENPDAICDVGHNKDGIKMVLQHINLIPHKTLHFVFGMVNDKNPDPILCTLPENANYYFCKAAIPRSLDQNELKRIANQKGLKGESFVTVNDALKAARINAASDDLIFVGGSTFVVAEVL